MKSSVVSIDPASMRLNTPVLSARRTHYVLVTSNATPVIGLSPESHFKRREKGRDNNGNKERV